MKHLVAPAEIAFAMKELGFDEECFGIWKDTIRGPKWEPRYKTKNSKVKYSSKLDRRVPIPFAASPTWGQAFEWFREKYDLHVQIRKENYFLRSAYEYFHFDISRGREIDITKQEDLLSDIYDECSQDIPGNYLNDEKYSKLVFEKKFAFKTYEEIELACLKQLINIVKQS